MPQTNRYPPLTDIILIIPVLTVGGAEKAIANMANWWAQNDVRVFLICFREGSTPLTLHPDVKVLFLNNLSPQEHTLSTAPWPSETKNIALLRSAFLHCLNQTKTRPVPTISFLTRMNIRTILAASELPLTVVVSERSFPPLRPLGVHMEQLRRKVYPKAHNVVFQTDRASNWSADFLPEERRSTIPNGVFSAPEAITPLEALPQHISRFIMTAGRLSEEKQFHLFIDAFARLADRHPDLHGIIAGEGQQQGELELQIAKKNMTGRIHLPGIVPKLQQYMRKAECFVLTSKYEGFPNVLLESLSAGCPVVSFDCKAGPKEIIRDGIDGFIVPPDDVTALSNAIESIVQNRHQKLTMGQAARQGSSRFSSNKIMQQWENLFY